MVRPIKRRRVCKMPSESTFGPVEKRNAEVTFMSIEGYETIRLMDHEGFTQEETADLMGVARSTIQRIYDEARKAIADSLVNGKTLKIQGGNYTLCSEVTEAQGSSDCTENENCPKKKTGRRCCEQ